MALDTANALTTLAKAKDYLGYPAEAYQVVKVVCVSDVAGSLGGTYFLISIPTVDYYVWIDVADGSADPSITGRTGVEVDIASGATAQAVATAITTKVAALAGFGADRSGSNITITNAATGRCTPAADGDTGFLITTQVVGEEADTSHDDGIEEHINRASWYLNTMTGRKLLARDLTEYYDGDGEQTLILNEYPVNSITSIYIDAGRSYGSDTLVDSGDYTYHGDGGIVYLDGSTGTGRNAVKITYNAGYATVPYDIEAVCLQLVSVDHQREIHKAVGVSSRTDDMGGSITYTDSDKLRESVIAKYMRKYR